MWDVNWGNLVTAALEQPDCGPTRVQASRKSHIESKHFWWRRCLDCPGDGLDYLEKVGENLTSRLSYFLPFLFVEMRFREMVFALKSPAAIVKVLSLAGKVALMLNELRFESGLLSTAATLSASPWGFWRSMEVTLTFAWRIGFVVYAR